MNNLSPKHRHLTVTMGSLLLLGVSVLLIKPWDSTNRYRGKQLEETDNEGNRWALAFIKGPSRTALRNGITPGGPLTVSVNLRTRGAQALLDLQVQGQAGERYLGGARKNGRRMPAPQFEIIAKSGQMVGSGTFRYG